jgi:hypothetical protein
VLQVSGVIGACLVPRLAWAGSYLDRASLLVFEANSELDYLRRKLYDRELGRMLHELSEARLRAGRDMLVPKEVIQAHPHLLLFLENCERAAGHAAEGRGKAFVKFLSLARSEEQLFRGILKQLGWELPEFRR